MMICSVAKSVLVNGYQNNLLKIIWASPEKEIKVRV